MLKGKKNLRAWFNPRNLPQTAPPFFQFISSIIQRDGGFVLFSCNLCCPPRQISNDFQMMI